MMNKEHKNAKTVFFFIYKWKNKCKQDEWCKDRMDLIQELKLWYQMLQAGIQGGQDGWWKLGWVDQRDDRMGDMMECKLWTWKQMQKQMRYDF